MAINPLKALLFTGGGVVAAGGAAYVSGALDPLFSPPPPAQVAMLPAAPAADSVPAPGTEARVEPPVAPAASAPAAEPAASAPAEPAAAEAVQLVLPTFDVVRVEGGGSVVIAGHAAPKARVEALMGETVLGAADAGPDGAFAIVPDAPLKPGDHQIALRATLPDGTVAASAQTAVVSVPEKADGQVLAMVEEPGKPAELMAVPEPDKKPEAPAETAAQAPAAEPQPPAAGPQAPAAVEEPAAAEVTPAEPKPAEPAAPAVAAAKVAVDAVEIDGGRIFVAGTTDPGRTVRAYANEILLGEARAAPDGHFLVEAARDLPVGTYTVRVDALDADGAKVAARAAVPFEREPGEAIAAVAPAEPAKPAETGKPADGVPETVSPKLEHADSAVIIRRHDTLWRISRRVYGHGTRYSTIYLANQDQIDDPDKIWPGQVFKLPGQSREGEPADLTGLGDQVTTAPPKPE